MKRYIRRKLNVINDLKTQNEELKKKQEEQKDFLKKLSAEYSLMGKDCEKEGMDAAAQSNYEKALQLDPDNKLAQRRLKRLIGKK